MTGIINLYKPSGITSSRAVVEVRKILGTSAVGHMGTLDPQGEGVLILGVGKATRLFEYFLVKDKVYEAEFTFGVETDTLDGEGNVIREGGYVPTQTEIEAKLKTFIGKQSQLPPKYSAKKIDGRKAYELARNGREFELKPCEIQIYDFESLAFSDNKIKVRVHCSSGTYIRSLCRDLAYSLGTYAIMTAIKRTRCGSLTADRSVKLDEVCLDSVLRVEDALPELERLEFAEKFYKPLCNGMNVRTDREGKFLVFCKDELFGIGIANDGFLKIKTYLREE